MTPMCREASPTGCSRIRALGCNAQAARLLGIHPPIIKHEPKQMPDLIDDGTWREASVARMSEVFVSNRGLRPMYMLMARAHRYAIDYIEQAPVIVLAAAHGSAHVRWTERAFIQEQFRKMCESKARLRDVMHSYGLPLPLRSLDGRVLTATRATAIRRLALMNPSTLAHIIPTTRQKQNAWLEALQSWCEAMAHRSERNNYRCLFFEWAATNYPGVTYTEAKGVGHMADFVSARVDTFNPRWTRERACAEEQKWHADLALTEGVKLTGVPLDTVIDYTPLPLLREYGGLSFVALQTGTALRAEGAAMHHCVASYWKNVVEGRSRIYSILENGRRVATLELTGGLTQYNRPNAPLAASVRGIGPRSRYQVSQLVGTRNSRPAPEVAKVVGIFLAEINNRVRGATTVGAID
jgi:PcfJ-like protein